jgi:hypothetical protein
MYTSRSRFGVRAGIASLTLVLAAASFQPSAAATAAVPTAPAGSPVSEVDNFVTWVYTAVLFREPDQQGFDYWTNHVEQHGAGPFVHGVVESQEWREAWVDGFYDGIWLGRHADVAGLAYWSAYLADHRFDSFESFLSGSQEAYDLAGGTDELYVDFVYTVAAFGDPSDEEISEGLATLAAGPRSDFTHMVLNSEDGLAAQVGLAYNVTLDRAPDPEGEAYWMGYYHETGSLSHMLGFQLLSEEAWDLAQTGSPTADPQSAFRR